MSTRRKWSWKRNKRRRPRRWRRRTVGRRGAWRIYNITAAAALVRKPFVPNKTLVLTLLYTFWCARGEALSREAAAAFNEGGGNCGGGGRSLHQKIRFVHALVSYNNNNKNNNKTTTRRHTLQQNDCFLR